MPEDRTRRGMTDRMTGRSVTAYTNAHRLPNATMLPMTRKGGMSAKFRLRNPIAVVSEVRKTGQILTRSD